MFLDQPALSDSSGASPASTMVRSGSEPPDINGVNGVNEVNGLRRARNPIKVAGITMGSQDNLDTVNDELADVFANRRRRRRSATPVKIGGITMGDQATEQSVLFSSFFICEPASNCIAGYVKALPLDLGSFNFANMIVHLVEIGFIIGQYYLILSHLQN